MLRRCPLISPLSIAAFLAAWFFLSLPAQAADETSAGDAPAKTEAAGGDMGKAAEPKKYPDWDTVVKGATKLDGLFPLYFNEKDQKLFIEIGGSQFDRDLICPISIARGAGGLFLGGDTLNFGDQWVLSFRRAADRVLVVRRNVYFKAREGTPQSEAVKLSYNDSVIAALAVKSEQGGRVLVDAADLFMTDLANIGVRPDPSRSTWGKIKSFPNNIGIEVNAVFPFGGGGGFFFFFGGGPEVPDYRGVQVVMHYGLSLLPAGNGYQPRAADDRVGHFLSTMKDYTTDADKSAMVRYINRWRLEKSDSAAEKSPAKEPIIFWIERTVPREYRSYVKDGILEWNKAFEKVGFLDAIQVRDQQSSDDFDPEDIRFNTFRWIATSRGFAMGPSRTNPLTGQILDADILFDESMVRYWRQEFLRLAGLPQSMEMLWNGYRQPWLKLHAADVPRLAAIEPLMNRLLNDPAAKAALNERTARPGMVANPWAPQHLHQQCCNMGPGIAHQLGLMAAVMSAQGKIPPGGKVPEEFLGQAIKEVTMHEVGHTLGLRHNFKASTMLSLEDCHNTEITGKKGMAGSVMDYLPANIARKGQKQGHYFSPTIGPYDYWAIEYAYKPISGSEPEELAKIASRVAEPDLAYGTDEDVFGSPDPRVNLFDLGDPLEYAKQQIHMVEDHLADLTNQVVADGEGWQRARDAFGMLLGEFSRSTAVAASYVGAELTHRDHRGDPNARNPYEPVPVSKQRDAIAFLSEHVLSDKAFKFPPDLLKKLAPEYWADWESSGPMPEYPVSERVLAIQRIVLSQFLSNSTLARLRNVEGHAAPEQEVLKMPEVFDALTKAIWTELPAADAAPAADAKLEITSTRRSLQREHYKRLSQMVLGPRSGGFAFGGFISLGDSLFNDAGGPTSADARSLARLHLAALQARIKKVLENKQPAPDTYSLAHLQELDQQISRVLGAEVEVNEP